jgi:Cyclin, N-terminal domain
MGQCCETENKGFHEQHGYVEPQKGKSKYVADYEQFDDNETLAEKQNDNEQEHLLAKKKDQYNLFAYENDSQSPIVRSYQSAATDSQEQEEQATTTKINLKKRNERRKSVRFDLPVEKDNEKEREKEEKDQEEEEEEEGDDDKDDVYTRNGMSASSSSSSTARNAGNDDGPRFPQGMRRVGMASSLVAEAKKARYKSSSTATMFLKSTLSSPDVDELIKCLAYAMHLHMQAAEEVEVSMLEKKEANIFDEDQFPLMREPGLTDTQNPPTIEHVYKFIHTTFTVERLSHECAILCLAYVERMMTNSRVRLRPNTWRRIVLGALILASKVWEDQAVWNVDFLAVFPAVTVKDLGRLEAKYLNLLSFSVGLKASVYAKYYFELRDLSDKDESNFPLKPLDKDGQRRLEERSLSEQERHSRRAMPARSQSADFGVSPRSPPAVLN